MNTWGFTLLATVLCCGWNPAPDTSDLPGEDELKAEVAYEVDGSRHVQLQIRLENRGERNIALDLPRGMAFGVADTGVNVLLAMPAEIQLPPGGVWQRRLPGLATGPLREPRGAAGLEETDGHLLERTRQLANIYALADEGKLTSDPYEVAHWVLPQVGRAEVGLAMQREAIVNAGGESLWNDVRASLILSPAPQAAQGDKQPVATSTPGYTGVYPRDVSDPAIKGLGIDAASGAVVHRVISNSPGETAGLQPGDVIVACNGTVVRNFRDFMTATRDAPAGTKLIFDIHRGREALRVELVVGERKAPPTTIAKTPDVPTVPPSRTIAPQPPPRVQRDWPWKETVRIPRRLDDQPRLIGLSVESAGRPAAQALGIESPIGAVITQVHAGTTSAQAGLRRGDLIVRFSGRNIENLEDLEAATLASPVGRRQEVTVVRGRQRLSVPLQIGVGDASRLRLQTYAHPSGTWELTLFPAWKVQDRPQREPARQRAYDVIESSNGNYFLYVYHDASAAPSVDESLAAFVTDARRTVREPQVGRIDFDGVPAVFVAGAFGEQRRHTLYRMALVVQGRRYEIDAYAPPLSDPVTLTDVLEVILGTVTER
jgi:S1-C subfamily serine protease